MKFENWLNKNTATLKGKMIAVTGTTGGLGRHLCRFLAQLGASLILMDRNAIRSQSFREELIKDFPDVTVNCVNVDLEDISSVKQACEVARQFDFDIFIHNAGAYSIPRKTCTTGYDNVFQINFASPYYMINQFLPHLRKKNGKVVVVSSIAHNYSKINEADIDFSQNKHSSKVYGNAKRYLTFSLFELFKNEKQVSLAITHPGIAFTNITAHYPKFIFAIIKYPMKVIFMTPKKASLCVLKGVFKNTDYHQWIGPRLFDVWGLPKQRCIKTCTVEESKKIFKIAQKVYSVCQNT